MTQKLAHPFDLAPDDYEAARKAGLGWTTEAQIAQAKRLLDSKPDDGRMTHKPSDMSV